MNVIKARSHRVTKARRGFSLIEVLLAIVILGIGIISIAALFPAGIAQQRLSTDDVMGPIVADHATGVIRSRVSAEDFGTFEEFWPWGWSGSSVEPGNITRTTRGDWGWMRPSYLLPGAASGLSGELGTIDIFSRWRVDQVLNETGANAIDVATENWEGWPEQFNGTSVPSNERRLYGIPFSRQKHTATSEAFEQGAPVPFPPRIHITQRERYYPMRSDLIQDDVDPPRPQYVWECMFRRYHGRVYVAIFVYRVNVPGTAGATSYAVQPRPGPSNEWRIPPLPIAIDMTPGSSGTGWPAYIEPWDVEYDSATQRPIAEVRGFNQDVFDIFDENQAWQAQRQWILDQNNNIYRVLANRREGSQTLIELTRPLSPVRLPYLPGSPTNPYDNAVVTTGSNWPTYSADEYYGAPSSLPNNPALPTPQQKIQWFPNFDRGVVTRFWYIPLRMENETLGVEYSLTPVYVTVKEL